MYSFNIYIMSPLHFVDRRMGWNEAVEIDVGAFSDGVWL